MLPAILSKKPDMIQVPDAPAACTADVFAKTAFGVATAAYQVSPWFSTEV
jgi:hypothetical protein